MIRVVENRYSGEQETHWDKTNKRRTSLKIVIFFVCLLPVRFLLTSITVFFCTTWMASCKGPIKFMNACKTSRLVFPSDRVWGSCRTLITQSKTKLELVNRVISAEKMEIRTLAFSSDSGHLWHNRLQSNGNQVVEVEAEADYLNQSRCTFPRFVTGLVLPLLVATPSA